MNTTYLGTDHHMHGQRGGAVRQRLPQRAGLLAAGRALQVQLPRLLLLPCAAPGAPAVAAAVIYRSICSADTRAEGAGRGLCSVTPAGIRAAQAQGCAVVLQGCAVVAQRSSRIPLVDQSGSCTVMLH